MLGSQESSIKWETTASQRKIYEVGCHVFNLKKWQRWNDTLLKIKYMCKKNHIQTPVHYKHRFQKGGPKWGMEAGVWTGNAQQWLGSLS